MDLDFKIIRKEYLQQVYGLRQGIDENLELSDTDFLSYYMINMARPVGSVWLNDKVFRERTTLNSAGKEVKYFEETGVTVVDVDIEQVQLENGPIANRYIIYYSDGSTEVFDNKAELDENVTDIKVEPTKGAKFIRTELGNGRHAFMPSDYLIEVGLLSSQKVAELEKQSITLANELNRLKGSAKKQAYQISALEDDKKKAGKRIADMKKMQAKTDEALVSSGIENRKLKKAKKEDEETISQLLRERNKLKRERDYAFAEINKLTGKDSSAARKIRELILAINAKENELSLIKETDQYKRAEQEAKIRAEVEAKNAELEKTIDSIKKADAKTIWKLKDGARRAGLTIQKLNKVNEDLKKKVKSIKKKAIAAVIVVGLATGVGGWIAKTVTDKDVFQDKTISWDAEQNWNAMLEKKLGAEVVGLRGQDGAVEFFAKKDGKITFYTATNTKEVKDWVANREQNKEIENFAKRTVQGLDIWTNSFNTEAMTALYDGIEAGKVALTSQFTLSDGEDIRAIDGKDYDLNGFVNDGAFTGVTGSDRIVIAENKEGEKVVVVDNESHKVAYVTMVVMPEDHNKDATVIEKIRYYGVYEEVSKEEMLRDILKYGETVAEFNVENIINENELSFAEVNDQNVSAKEVYNDEKANEVKEELVIANVIDVDDKVTAKVNEYEREDGKKVVYYNYEDIENGPSMVKVEYDKHGNITGSESYVKIDKETATEAVYKTVSGKTMTDKDELYASTKVSYDHSTKSTTGVLTVVTVTANTNCPTITEKQNMAVAASKTSPLTNTVLLEIVSNDINGKAQTVKGTFSIDRTKGTVVESKKIVENSDVQVADENTEKVVEVAEEDIVLE